MKSAALGGLITIVAMFFAVSAAAQTTCTPQMATVAFGKSFHGAMCKHANGCRCSASKCVTQKFSFSGMTTTTEYKSAGCPPAPSILSGGLPTMPGCKTVEGSIDNGKSFHGAKCAAANGCFCDATVCGGKTKKAKCVKAPT